MSSLLCLILSLCLCAYVVIRPKVWEWLQPRLGNEKFLKFRDWEDVLLFVSGAILMFIGMYYFNTLRPAVIPLWATLTSSVINVIVILALMFNRSSIPLMYLIAEPFRKSDKLSRKERVEWRLEVLKEQTQMHYPKMVVFWTLLKRLLICRLAGHRYAQWMDHKSSTCRLCRVARVEDPDNVVLYYDTTLFPAKLIPLRHEYAVFNRELKKKES